jgi:hypothetical protein
MRFGNHPFIMMNCAPGFIHEVLLVELELGMDSLKLLFLFVQSAHVFLVPPVVDHLVDLGLGLFLATGLILALVALLSFYCFESL